MCKNRAIRCHSGSFISETVIITTHQMYGKSSRKFSFVWFSSVYKCTSITLNTPVVVCNHKYVNSSDLLMETFFVLHWSNQGFQETHINGYGRNVIRCSYCSRDADKVTAVLELNLCNHHLFCCLKMFDSPNKQTPGIFLKFWHTIDKIMKPSFICGPSNAYACF